MDDRHSQFLIVVGGVCEGAASARLPVTFELADGSQVSGVPAVDRGDPAAGAEEVDETGLTDAIAVGDAVIGLREIRRCSIDAPGR